MKSTRRVAHGVLSGVAATSFLQTLMKGTTRVDPEAKAPMLGDPAEFILSEVAGAQLGGSAQKAAAAALHFTYGTTAALLYALVRPRVRHPLLEGVVLGLGVWAAGYLGWLPAAGLLPPLATQRTKQVVVPLAQHVAFGIAVVSLIAALERR